MQRGRHAGWLCLNSCKKISMQHFTCNLIRIYVTVVMHILSMLSLFIFVLVIIIHPIEQIDSLDTLALLGNREQFGAAVEWVGKNVRFDIVSIKVLYNSCYHLGSLNNIHANLCLLLTFIKLLLDWKL